MKQHCIIFISSSISIFRFLSNSMQRLIEKVRPRRVDEKLRSHHAHDVSAWMYSAWNPYQLAWPMSSFTSVLNQTIFETSDSDVHQGCIQLTTFQQLKLALKALAGVAPESTRPEVATCSSRVVKGHNATSKGLSTHILAKVHVLHNDLTNKDLNVFL